MKFIKFRLLEASFLFIALIGLGLAIYNTVDAGIPQPQQALESQTITEVEPFTVELNDNPLSNTEPVYEEDEVEPFMIAAQVH